MLKLTTPAGVFGPYAVIDTLSDRYRCDGGDLPLAVVGTGTIGEWTEADIDPEVVAERKAAELLVKRSSMIVTPWQIRKALNAVGLRDSVEYGVAAADQATKDAWEFAQEFKRLDPLVVNIGLLLGKTDDELDAIFELAASL